MKSHPASWQIDGIGATPLFSPVEDMLFALLWTVYFAFKSGTDVAFIFDSLKSYKAEKQFQHVIARYRSWEYVGLIASGLLAGLIATTTNLQVPFWLSILPLTLGVVALWRLPEPKIERHEEQSSVWRHAAEAWREIKQKGMIWVTILFAMLSAIQLIWYEYYQLYGLAVAAPEVWFGSLIAVLCLGLTVGSEVTRRIVTSKKTITLFWLVLIAAHLSGLLITHFLTFLLALFVTMIAIQVLYLGFLNTINQGIGSTRRATIISLAGSASQLLFLVIALLFRAVVDVWSVQAAFVIASLPLLILGLVDLARRVPWLLAGGKVDVPQDKVEIEVR